MAVKSSTFGRVELSGKEAKRFVERMREVKSDPKVQESAKRGRAILAKMQTPRKVTC